MVKCSKCKKRYAVVFVTKLEDGEKKTETASFSQGEEDGVKYVKIGLVKYNKVK